MLGDLKKVWRRFYDEHKKGYLPKELSDVIDDKDIVRDELTNIYNYSDILDVYISIRETKNENNIKACVRARETLDIFVKFVNFAKNYK